MKSTLHVVLAVLSLFVLQLFVAVPTASADSISFNITDINLSGFTGPFASVTVNRTDSTHATITFTAGSGGGDTYLMGDGSTVALNVAGTFSATATGSNSISGF